MFVYRMGEYKKQEEAARNLYKVKPKNPYFFWSVMSLVLQAIEGDPKLGQSVHLPLAQRKVAKMAVDGKMEQDQKCCEAVFKRAGDYRRKGAVKAEARRRSASRCRTYMTSYRRTG